MLSTVVLPAPFGPIRVVIARGFAFDAQPVTARTPPNAIVRPSTARAAPVGAGSSVIAARVAGTAARRRPNQRAASPTMPSGAISSTASSSAPKKSRRYSARPARTSGSATTTAAPTSGPVTVPAPPIITTSTNRIDCENENVDGVTKPDSGANSAPASPAQAAETANATVFTATGFSPIDSAAVSESFTARIAAPQSLFASRHEAPRRTAVTTIAMSATPRSPKASPSTDGDG